MSARGDASGCFVCGSDNPIGLKVRFELDGDHVRGRFTSKTEHAGFDGVTHGGIVFSILDDAMANWFYLQGARGFTAKAEIRYRSPMPVGATAEIDCELTRRKGRLVQLAAIARSEDGAVFAETEASFMLDEAGALGD